MRSATPRMNKELVLVSFDMWFFILLFRTAYYLANLRNG
jgi:hypothetical protein